MINKKILQNANEAIAAGDYEKFLSFCTDDTNWIFVGDQTLKGKEAVRAYFKTAYIEPPKFMVETLIEEGEFVTAVGKISMKDKDGKMVDFNYCDVWKFRDGKLFELQAFVI
ncbi:nuclear transport factor 2 family protein [Pedobacter nototheniae]|uniref:nuclear transport factor 2 family protein n=1 Tax=Pedobacter nototheniae TaxID=2488994 RepID=UPI002930F322|nr:nuclear transport factor 2 family protein [Pedobacter nototheniae]